jgi:hypothetical protein
MPQTMYRQVTDAEGNVSFQPEEVPTPSELAEAEAKTRKANKEAMERRLELERLQGGSRPNDPSGAQDTPVPPAAAQTPPAPVPAAPVVDEESIVDKAIARIEAKKAAQAEADAALKALLAANKLPDSYLEVLRNSTDPKGTAETLGRANLQFAQTPTGDSRTRIVGGTEAVIAGFRKIGLRHPDDPNQD